MLTLAMQYGARPDSGSLLGPIVLIIGGGLAGALLIPLVRFALQHGRVALRARRSRRRRVSEAAGAERRARALMGELCPHGWHAEIHLHTGESRTEGGDPVRAPVSLDWFELTPGGTEPAVMRRVWAETIGEALEAMVSDRRTDETLEQIELRATAEGELWPD